MITIPVFAVCFIIFIVWTQYEMKKDSKAIKKREDEFLAREYEANHTEKKDISDLPLMHIDESVIPLPPDGMFTDEDDIVGYIKNLKNIIKEPMIDLSEYSNTDLKLTYGTANFTLLSQYDTNYSSFLLLLTNLARGYARRELYDLAERTYRVALESGSIKLQDYTGLAEVYLAQDNPAGITELIEEVRESELPRKDGIIEALRRELAKY